MTLLPTPPFPCREKWIVAPPAQFNPKWSLSLAMFTFISGGSPSLAREDRIRSVLSPLFVWIGGRPRRGRARGVGSNHPPRSRKLRPPTFPWRGAARLASRDRNRR